MTAAVYAAMTVSGFAQSPQPPRELTPSSTLDMHVGQTKVLQFSEPFGSGQIVFSQKDIVDPIPPQNDRQLAFIAKTPGITRLYVNGSDGRTLFDAEIIVSPDRGRLVRIYNTGKNDDLNAGYVGVYCDQFGCSRPDKDLPPPTSVNVNRHTHRGSGAGAATAPPPPRVGF